MDEETRGIVNDLQHQIDVLRKSHVSLQNSHIKLQIEVHKE